MLVVVTRTGYNMTLFYDDLQKAYDKAWAYARQGATVLQIYGLKETGDGVCYVLFDSLLGFSTKKIERKYGGFY